MIERLSRKQLDVAKYDECIAQSFQRRIYAFSWYLDIVADDWDVLVLSDYVAVMPIPYMRIKRNLFVKKIIQPLLCQQLGIFSPFYSQKKEMSLYKAFLELSPKDYSFNSHNLTDTVEKNRINYELNLNLTYAELRKNYKKGRKHAISQARKNGLHIASNESVEKLCVLASENYNISVYKKTFFKKLSLLIEEVINREKGQLFYITKGQEIIGGAFFLIDENRIINLFSAFNDEGKKLQASSFIIDYIIETYDSTEYVLDFEGSMISSIASFFRSFGAIENNYHRFCKE